MKNIKTLADFITESLESYEWKFESDRTNIIDYTFIDDEKNKYLVQFKNIKDISNEFELVYFVHDGECYTVSKLVGSNVYKTLKTVFTDILNDFIKRNLWIKKIVINGLSKDQESEFISQRTRVYDRHLERNPIKGFRKQVLGNRINLIKI